MKPAGVILAGGKSSRMGADKALAVLHGRAMIDHVAKSMRPQVQALLINSNGDPGHFVSLGHPVLPDCLPGQMGPLAGILTGMIWARRCLPEATHLLVAPCDIPGLPRDIGQRLAQALAASGADIAIARDESGPQPTVGLWPIALADRLAPDLGQGQRGMQAWLQQFTVSQVPQTGLHNINTPGELHAAALQQAAI